MNYGKKKIKMEEIELSVQKFNQLCNFSLLSFAAVLYSYI